jgi:hypothetical protein
VSISKKAAVPNCSLGYLFCSKSFCKALLEPVISCFDFGHLLDGPLLHRGDPFSHPSGSSAADEKAFLFFLLFLYIKSFFVFIFDSFPCAHPASGGTRKPSVPVRVHSVRESFGFADSRCQAPASNPFLTRDTVESPAKLFQAVPFCR